MGSAGGEATVTPAGDALGEGATGAPALVEIEGLSRSFGETQALVSAALTIERGEIHALAGENGSGKTTLIKVLGGVLRPDSGEVRWNGAPVRFSKPRAAQAAGISVVYQETLVAPELSVRDNIFFGSDGIFRRRNSPDAEGKLAAAALAELGLPRFDLDRPVWTLSLAERQIVTIARATIRPWELLILDEGTSALDADQRTHLFDYLRRTKASGRSVLFTSHRMDEIADLADSVSVLRLGSTVVRSRMSETTPDEILKRMADPDKMRATGRGEGPASGRVSGSAERRPLLRTNELHLGQAGLPVSIEICQGEILGLAGLEGHGQVEFAETLCALRSARKGAVQIATGNGTWMPVRRRRHATRHGIAYVPRDRKQEGLFFPLSILDNFSIALFPELERLGVLGHRAARERLRETGERLRLSARRPSDLVSVLSGGNQQKVLLGRWLATNPRVLVLNDPLRGVDANTKLEFYELLRSLANEGLTVVLVSTEILELLTLADRIAVFHRGALQRILSSADATDGAVISAMFGHGDPETTAP